MAPKGNKPHSEMASNLSVAMMVNNLPVAIMVNNLSVVMLPDSMVPPSPPVDLGSVSDRIQAQSSVITGIGFLAAVTAQICGSIGLLLMKSASIHEYHLPWYQKGRLGLGIFFQGFFPIFTDSFAYAVCPLSLLAPLSGITIAATIIFTAARCCGVREPVHFSDFVVVLLILAGVTFVNVYGPHSSSNLDMLQLKS